MPDADRRLPAGAEIFLDHVAHFVPDRDAAREALTCAGFQATPVSIQVDPGSDPPHPTGTGNVTAMLRRGYIEVLFKTADTALGRELDAALARHAGVHLAAFSVADAGAAHARLAATGFRVRPLAAMQRPVETEAGPATAAFTVARVEAPEMAEGRIQILTHHTESAVWQPRRLTHPNGAVGLLDLAIAVADADEAAGRFARFTARPAEPGSHGRVIRLDRGRIQLMDVRAFAALLPELAIPSLPFAGAYGVQVESLARAEAVLRDGLSFRRHGRALVAQFPEALGAGAWVFVERPEDMPWRSR